MSKRRRPAAARRMAEQRFWGKTADVAAEDGTDGGAPAPATDGPAPIRPTTDPAALVRSLGGPPLAVDSGLVERHFTAVYEEAVRAATALAAANGLLAGEDEETT